MLVNCPLVNQLNEPTTDGGPDESARSNCVPACLTSAILALVPGATINGAPINGDALRDKVYPESYTGATDPAQYVSYLAAAFQITMTRFPQSGTAPGGALVSLIVAALQHHEPVSGAIPSQWGTAPADPLNPVRATHEVVWCDYDGVNLTAMNPWPVMGSAFYQTQPLAWWAARIVYGRVFTLAKEADMAFIKQPDGSARDDQTGVVLHFGMAEYVLSRGTTAHALMGETYYTGEDSFVPLSGGLVLSYNKAENAVRDDRAGEVLQNVWQQLVAAKATPPDPAAEHAKAQVAAIAAILAH